MAEENTHELRSFLNPTKIETISYIGLGIIPIIFAKLSILFAHSIIVIHAQESVHGFTRTLDQYSKFTGALFWFMIGSLIYLLLWSAIVVIIDSYNDVLVSVSFVHPRSFHQSSYWVSIVARTLIHVAASLVLLGSVFFIARPLLGYCYSLSYEAWLKHFSPTTIKIFLWVFLLTILYVHATTLLLRLAFLKKRLF